MTQITGDNMTVPGILTVATQMSAAVLCMTITTFPLTATALAVSTLNKGHIQLSSDSAVAADRIFALSAGQTGQRLTLEWTGANAGKLVKGSANGDSGNVRLSADWVPGQYDTLTLVFNGTDWIETSRSTNA
jgi:hypothetical protein